MTAPACPYHECECTVDETRPFFEVVACPHAGCGFRVKRPKPTIADDVRRAEAVIGLASAFRADRGQGPDPLQRPLVGT